VKIGNRALKRYADQAGTVFKSLIINGGNAGWYGYAGKAGASGKSSAPNADNATSYGYAGKAGGVVKSQSPNFGNGVRYGDTGNVVGYGHKTLKVDGIVIIKSVVSNFGNGDSVYLRGYGYAAAGSFVFCYYPIGKLEIRRVGGWILPSFISVFIVIC